MSATVLKELKILKCINFYISQSFWCVTDVNNPTVTLQRQLDVAQCSSVLQQVGCCIRQDVVRLGCFEEEL